MKATYRISAIGACYTMICCGSGGTGTSGASGTSQQGGALAGRGGSTGNAKPQAAGGAPRPVGATVGMAKASLGGATSAIKTTGSTNAGGTGNLVTTAAAQGGRSYGTSGIGGTAIARSTSIAGSTSTSVKPTFDWVGVVGSGQSLSVGFTPPNLTKAYYNNLMLKLGSTSFPGTGKDNPTAPVPGTASKPWDTSMSELAMAPLVEPLRAEGSGYPRPYPINLWGETHHGAMAREITHFVTTATPGADYITVHTIVGESRKGVTALIKQKGSTTGDVGRAYAATLLEVGAINRLAKAAGKTYGVGVVVMTHGETDADPPNAEYKTQLIQLMSDYNNDIAAITGQTYKIPMYINQQHAYPSGAVSKGKRPDVNNMQWQLGVDHKDSFVCTGPKYQYQGNSNGDGVHLSVQGVEMLGEKAAQVYYERAVLGHEWQPLHPTSVERSGRVVTVYFHVPVPPLNWDTTFDAPAITEWKNGQGFELRSATANITIESVKIVGSDVQNTARAPLVSKSTGTRFKNSGTPKPSSMRRLRFQT